MGVRFKKHENSLKNKYTMCYIYDLVCYMFFCLDHIQIYLVEFGRCQMEASTSAFLTQCSLKIINIDVILKFCLHYIKFKTLFILQICFAYVHLKIIWALTSCSLRFI